MHVLTKEEKDHLLIFRTTTSVSRIQTPGHAEMIFFFSVLFVGVK